MKHSFKMLTLSITGCCLLAGSAWQTSYASSNTVQESAVPSPSVVTAVTAVPIAAPAPVSQLSSLVITGKAVKEQTDQLQIDVTIPVVEGMKDSKYQDQLNDIIARHAMEDLEAIKKQADDAAAKAKEAGLPLRPHSINIQYEVTSSAGASNDNILSIKMTTYAFTGGANGTTRIDTYNVRDEAQAKRVELKELFGDSYKEQINEQIRQAIAQTPDSYFKGSEGFQGISDTQSFYIEEGAAVIVFPKYEIAPGSSGSPEFRIPLSNSSAAVPAGVKISSKVIKEDLGYAVANLNIPVLEGMKDKSYESQLNARIEQHALENWDNLKTQAQKDELEAKKAGYPMRPYSLDIQYEVKTAGGASDSSIVSLKITSYTYTGGAHGMPAVDTYTVRDEPQASQVELKDLFGANFEAYLNQQIEQQIAQNPDNYFKDSFKGITDNQTFYIEKDAAVILFGAYAIAPYAAGTPEFRIALPPAATPAEAAEAAAPSRVIVRGTELTASQASVFTGDNRMTVVPLRIIAEQLGYTVQWNGDSQTVEVSQGAQWTQLQTGKDSYIYNKLAPFGLGQAPEIKADGIMYVPIEFFSKVLKADVKVEADAVTIQ